MIDVFDEPGCGVGELAGRQIRAGQIRGDETIHIGPLMDDDRRLVGIGGDGGVDQIEPIDDNASGRTAVADEVVMVDDAGPEIIADVEEQAVASGELGGGDAPLIDEVEADSAWIQERPAVRPDARHRGRRRLAGQTGGEVITEFRRAHVAILRVLRHGPPADGVDRLELRIDRRQRLRLVRADPLGKRREILRLERPPAGDQFVENDSEREDVGANAQRNAARIDLLGGHVMRRAVELAASGQPATCRTQTNRQAEVDEDGRQVGAELDVRRLEIAMDPAAVVIGAEDARDLPHDLDPVARRPIEASKFGERSPLDVLHRKKGSAVVGGSVLVDSAESRSVLEERPDSGLGEERLAELRHGRELGTRNLERHLAMEHRIGGQVDDSVAAATEETLDQVFADAKKRGEVVHSGLAQRNEPSGVVNRIRCCDSSRRY